MKIITYISSLLNTVEKSTVTEDMRIVREELADTTLPSYVTAKDLFKKAPPTNKLSKLVEDAFKQRVGTHKVNYIQTIYRTLMTMSKNLDNVSDMVDKDIKNNVVRDALSYSDLTLIRYVEVAGFTSRYARRLLLTVYSLEIHGEAQPSRDTERDLKWLLDNLPMFVIAVNAMSRTEKETVKVLETAPSILVNEESIATIGDSTKSDPLNFRNMVGFRGNPIYHLRMSVANYQIAQQKLAAAEKESLELKAFHLKQLRDGTEDAKLEARIQATEERIAKARLKLHKMEQQAE